MAEGPTSSLGLSTGDRLLEQAAESRGVPKSTGSGETPEVTRPEDDKPLIGDTLMEYFLPLRRDDRGVDQPDGSDRERLSDSSTAESPPHPPDSNRADGDMSIRGEITMVGAGELAECQV